MPASDVPGYLAGALASYVNDVARGFGLPLDEARAQAQKQVDYHLPQGPATKGHYFFRIVDGDEAVGSLWFEEQLLEVPPRLYIFDIVIDPRFRGKGYGTAALRAVEEEAAERGAQQVMLAVYRHNEGALRLYTRLGYKVTESGAAGQRMAIAVGR
jgi:ribosomal protein S18 acetylase RimI-like enzyme